MINRLFARRHLSLSVKLTGGVVALLLVSVFTVGATIYFFQGRQLETQAQQGIEQAVQGMQQMISQSISHTIRAELQATADRDREIIAMLYSRYKAGLVSEKDAKEMAKDVLLSQAIGKNGYVYVVDSSGTLRVHPRPILVNVNISAHGFIREQMHRKSGYLEYQWRDPGDTRERPKALAMSYFEPWDYIISASAYRDEFLSLADLESFRNDVLSLKFGETGYAYVMDTKGTLLIHPELEGENIYNAEDADGRQFIAEMCRKKNGRISYPWKNPGENRARYKDVVFRYFPELDVIIAGGIYQEELFGPLRALRYRLMLILGGVLLFSVPMAFFAARALGKPVLSLSDLAARIAHRDLRVVEDFDKMTAEQQRGRSWMSRGSTEILVLLNAFREAGMSIRDLVSLLGAKSEKLSKQQAHIEKAASFSNVQVAEQKAIVSKVSSAVFEVQSAFSQTRTMVDEMHETAGEAVAKVVDGRDAVAEAEVSMSVVWDRSETTREAILKLGGMTDTIEQLIQNVHALSRHSQILSVNARIQAAKAGSAGRGFAVVAGEVRELAIQSAHIAEQIRKSVGNIQTSSIDAIIATSESSEAVAKGQESIHKLASVIGALNQVISTNSRKADRIAKIVAEQSDAIGGISSVVTQVERHSQAESRTAESLLETVEELRQTQSELSSLVVQYRV